MSEAKVNIDIFDTTLRDGAQSLPEIHQFPINSKSKIADVIANLGVTVIEAGFPVTPGDTEEVRAVAQTVGVTDYAVAQWEDGVNTGTQHRAPVIAGLSRTLPKDIETTWEAVKDAHFPRIHTFISTDERHRKAKFPNKTPEEVLDMGRRAVAIAREISANHAGASVEFSAEAATTTDTNYLEKVIREAVIEGADVINVPDTVGERDVFWMKNFYRQVIDWVHAENPNVIISAHNHNDLGQATMNSFSLLRAATEHSRVTGLPTNIQVETTICGLGERAGNADVFPFIAGVFKFSDSLPAPVVWEFNPIKSVSTAKYVMSAGGMEVSRQNPIVGSDINTHRSGIHSDGVIKGGHQIYTPINPMIWGHDYDAIHEEGRYQGKSGSAAAIARILDQPGAME